MRERKWRLRGDKGINVIGYERQTFNGDDIVREFSNDGASWYSGSVYALWHTDKQDFTGFHDRNGTEIYEGDKLENNIVHNSFVFWDSEEGRWCVRYDKTGTLQALFWFIKHECRVVKENK